MWETGGGGYFRWDGQGGDSGQRAPEVWQSLHGARGRGTNQGTAGVPWGTAGSGSDVTAVAQITAVVHIQSLAQEILHATGMAK